jgi:hypothetical protein
MARTENEYAGRVVITWPQTRGGMILGHTVALIDADSGELLVGVQDLTVIADLNGPIVAEMTMYTDADGQPLRIGMTLVRDGDTWRTGRFRWLVAEMHTALD